MRKKERIEDLSDAGLADRRARRMAEVDRLRRELADCELTYFQLAKLNELIRLSLKEIFSIDHTLLLRAEMKKTADAGELWLGEK